MTVPPPEAATGNALRLRGRMRPVTRINRKLLLLAATLGCAGTFTAFTLALQSPRKARGSGDPPSYNVTSKRTPDGLADLPSSYAAWQPSGDVPLLGTPMTGDLGGSIIAQEREWGLEPDWNVPPATDFRPSDIDEADRARRLTNAKLADQADKAGLFFDLSSRPPTAAADTAAPTAAPLGAGELLALAARPLQAAPADPNNQSGKLGFAEASPGRPTSNPYRLEAPTSPYQVMAGTLIPASLITAINSDLPGAIAAQVTQPVYDTVTGTFLLIPQGARLIGRYQSEISPGQNRVLVVWDRIIFPDGTSLRMAEQGSDTAGSAGLSDRADHHWSRIFAGAGLTTLLAIGAEAGSDHESDLERAVRRGFGDSVSDAGQRVADRDLGVQPTLTVRPGWPVRVLVTKDMVLRPYPTL